MNIAPPRQAAHAYAAIWQRVLSAGVLVVCSTLGACGSRQVGGAGGGMHLSEPQLRLAQALSLTKDPERSWTLDPAASSTKAMKACTPVPCEIEEPNMLAIPGYGPGRAARPGERRRQPVAIGVLPAVIVVAHRERQCPKTRAGLAAMLLEPTGLCS